MGQFLGTQIVVGFDPSLFLPRSETIGEHLRCQDAAKTRNESASKIDMGMAQIGKLLISQWGFPEFKPNEYWVA